MTRLVVMGKEPRIDLVEWGRGMLVPTQDRAATNVMEKNVKLMGLIGIAAIVEENVRAPSPFRLRGDSDGLGRWDVSGSRESRRRSYVRWGNDATRDYAGDIGSAWDGRCDL